MRYYHVNHGKILACKKHLKVDTVIHRVPPWRKHFKLTRRWYLLSRVAANFAPILISTALSLHHFQFIVYLFIYYIFLFYSIFLVKTSLIFVFAYIKSWCSTRSCRGKYICSAGCFRTFLISEVKNASFNKWSQ